MTALTKKSNEFLWTDDEIQLILEACIELKTKCDYEGVSWESKRNKYELIKDIVVERYPAEDLENFPRISNLDLVTKERIASKIKNIRSNFRKAVDSGRRSGGGRVIFTFYDICNNIWGGSPAVNSTENGIDTSENNESSVETNLNDDPDQNQSSVTGTETNTPGNSEDEFENDESEESGTQRVTLHEKTTQRRKDISQKLKSRKDKNLSSRMNTESQMLNICKEELTLKRKLLEKLDDSEKEHQENMGKVLKTMEGMSNAIQQSVGVLTQLVSQQNYNRSMTAQFGSFASMYPRASSDEYVPNATRVSGGEVNQRQTNYFKEGDRPYYHLN